MTLSSKVCLRNRLMTIRAPSLQVYKCQFTIERVGKGLLFSPGTRTTTIQAGERRHNHCAKVTDMRIKFKNIHLKFSRIYVVNYLQPQ